MIDLTKLFKSDRNTTEAKVPQVVSIIVEKSDSYDAKALATELETVGFKPTEIDDSQEGVVIFKASDEEGILIRVSDHTLAQVSKAELPESDLFAEEAQEGFFPSMEYATGKFNHVLAEAIAKGDTAAITAATSQYNEYISAYATTIPGITRQIDEVVTKACKKKPADMMDDEEDEKAKKEDAAETVVGDAAGDATGEVAAASEIPDGEGAGTVAEENPALELVAKLEAAITALTTKMDSSITELKDSVGAVTQSMDNKISTIQASLDSLGAKVGEVENVAKAASESVRGTVVGAPPAGDADVSTVRKAGDGDPRTGVFDTAYLPKRTVSARYR